MIPQDPFDPGNAFQALYENLYDQLGPDYKVCQYLDTELKQTKKLLWVQCKQQSVFIFISDLKEEALCPASQTDAKKNPQQLQNILLKNQEIQAVINFKKALLPQKGKAFHSQLVPFIIIYSQISKDKLNIKLSSQGLSLLGREYIESNDLKSLLHHFMGLETSHKIQQHIRKVFNPENCVLHKNRHWALLDNEQEIALKTDLYLNTNNKQANNCNLAGVNGGSYSGKSEVILQRAKLLRTLNQQQKILVLCANETLQNKLTRRYRQLTSEDTQTTIISLNNWCAKQLPDTLNIINNEQAHKAIKKAADYFLNQNKDSLRVFLQELDYTQKHIIKDEKDYIKRRPASMLNGETHSSIWKALQTLKTKLAAENYLLDNDSPNLLWQTIKAKNMVGTYDHILVDDAHYFSPLSFTIIRKHLKPETGQLFISQDPRQGIVNPISLWRDTGLDLRGKSTRLLNNYQINPYILNAANAFYMHRLPDDTDKVIQFNFIQDQSFKKPTLLHFTSERDEDNRLLNEIRVLLNKDIHLNDILIITTEQRSSAHCAELISHMLKLPVHFTKQTGDMQQANGAAIKISEIDKSLGLRFPYVFIFGLQKLFSNESEEARNTTHIDTDDFAAASYIENTRKLNSAMVCAQKELTLFMTSESIPVEFISPHISTPTINKQTLADVRPIKIN